MWMWWSILFVLVTTGAVLSSCCALFIFCYIVFFPALLMISLLILHIILFVVWIPGKVSNVFPGIAERAPCKKLVQVSEVLEGLEGWLNFIIEVLDARLGRISENLAEDGAGGGAAAIGGILIGIVCAFLSYLLWRYSLILFPRLAIPAFFSVFVIAGIAITVIVVALRLCLRKGDGCKSPQ